MKLLSRWFTRAAASGAGVGGVGDATLRAPNVQQRWALGSERDGEEEGEEGLEDMDARSGSCCEDEGRILN